MSQYTKYHHLLGVEPGDSKNKIKKAYRKMALKYHPDVNDSPQAHQMFLEITVAYEVLTGQRKSPSSGATVTPKTKEEILAEKVRMAKMRYEKMMQDEKRKDAQYYKKTASGWKWALFIIGAFYGLILSGLLTFDFFSVGERKTIQSEQLWHNSLNQTVTIKGPEEKFRVSEKGYWHNEKISVRANYSYLFHDLKSITVIVQSVDQWEEGKHSYKMRGYSDFDDFKTRTYYSSASIYSVFPFVHLFMLVPFILVLFKRPTLRFNMWRLVATWIIYPLCIVLTFSNDRIYHLIDLIFN